MMAWLSSPREGSWSFRPVSAAAAAAAAPALGGRRLAVVAVLIIQTTNGTTSVYNVSCVYHEI